jgi:hypothetical protein
MKSHRPPVAGNASRDPPRWRLSGVIGNVSAAAQDSTVAEFQQSRPGDLRRPRGYSTRLGNDRVEDAGSGSDRPPARAAPSSLLQTPTTHGAGAADRTGRSSGMADQGEQSPIVDGVDGSSCADDALDWAAVEASVVHRPLRIVHGFIWPLMRVPLDPSKFGPADGGLQAAARRTAAQTCPRRRRAHRRQKTSQPDRPGHRTRRHDDRCPAPEFAERIARWPAA